MLRAMDDEGNWLVRNGETGLCNLITDAFLYAARQTQTGADIALHNSGGIRTNIPAGEITFEKAYNVLPFVNTLCIVEVSGQTILDELEMGARLAPGNSRSLLHASGMTYVINATIPSSVIIDEEDLFVGVSGDRRVCNVLVNGEPIDPEKSYKVVATNYSLRDKGDGHMFRGAVQLEPDFVMYYDAFADYLKTFDAIPDYYAESEGRIQILTENILAPAAKRELIKPLLFWESEEETLTTKITPLIHPSGEFS